VIKGNGVGNEIIAGAGREFTNGSASNVLVSDRFEVHELAVGDANVFRSSIVAGVEAGGKVQVTADDFGDAVERQQRRRDGTVTDLSGVIRIRVELNVAVQRAVERPKAVLGGENPRAFRFTHHDVGRLSVVEEEVVDVLHESSMSIRVECVQMNRGVRDLVVGAQRNHRSTCGRTAGALQGCGD